MQCVEFEARLNHLLDERLSPTLDRSLLEHARDCDLCAELLWGHEALLEGVRVMPTVHLRQTSHPSEGASLAERVVMEVGSAASAPFPASGPMELATRRPKAVAANHRSTLALVGVALATAAALFIALSIHQDPEAVVPAQNRSLIVGTPAGHENGTSPTRIAAGGSQQLPPIAWLGYRVADGLTPVTNSMVSALRELRKRPLFRNPDDQRRSSFYSPHQNDEALA